jgi:DNA-binding GntR family transcriptional regulator
LLADADADPAHHSYYELVARFDDAVDEAVQNPFLVQALSAVRTHLARIRRLSRDNPARLLEAAREHLVIVDAILDGDAGLAADATRVHLYRSLQSTLGSLILTTENLTTENRPDPENRPQEKDASAQ